MQRLDDFKRLVEREKKQQGRRKDEMAAVFFLLCSFPHECVYCTENLTQHGLSQMSNGAGDGQVAEDGLYVPELPPFPLPASEP